MSAQDYEQLTLSAADSLASHFPWLESKKERGMTVTYGRRCFELSSSLRRVGSSVRMYLESCELPLPTLSRTWSAKVITSSCWILKLRLSERRTGEKGSRLLPTPCATLGTNGGPNQWDSSGRPGLQMAAMMWPTPRIGGSKSTSPAGSKHGDLAAVAGGQLNPDWVEWLMGLPAGWTNLTSQE